MKHKLRMIAVAVLVLLGIIIVMQNTQTVETQFLFATVKMPRAALLFITLLIGFVLGILVAWRITIKAK